MVRVQLRSATRFIRAVKNPTNSILIQADLETFYDYDSDHTADTYKQFVPCPYISMLYRSATCVGVDDGAYDICSTEDANMKSNGGDNNDGITIFDVTEPQNPRYCMVSVFGLEASQEEYHESNCYRPMSAKTYVEAYYPFLNPVSYEPIPERYREESIEEMRTAYQGLEGVTLIDSATLAEAFPEEYDPQSTEWTKEPMENDSSTRNDKGASDAPLDATPLIPSLFAITARKILQTVITEPDGDNDSVELLLRSPIDAPIIDILRIEFLEHSKLPDCVLPLLAKVLIDGSGARGFVGVTPFTLSPGQLTLIAPMISSCEILKFGGRNALHIDAVKTMISSLPSLKTLVLFDRGISIDEVESLYLVGHPGLQIGHKLSYFANSRRAAWQIGSRSAELEFVFMLSDDQRTWQSKYPQEAAGYVKMEDPNFAIRALCDVMSLLLSNGSYGRINGLSRVCFGVGDRPYGAVFASSSLVDLAPEPRFPTTATKWIFVLNSTPLIDREYAWSYGFVRYNAGEVVEILDLEGFVNALRTECPDLPAVVGFEDAVGDGSYSFYQKLGSIIGTSLPGSSESAPSVAQVTSSKIPCKLITREKVYEVIGGFTGQVKK